ncbi:hypothetical protein [Actinomadura sp. WMMB 499]|uniref:hypothetical protein n=1 Tax=Actinomadura sp. WMMB 499 TaxID=1219491 RepID=UPI001246F533|nr:hypothetical protein [Actinomadura sp. WMMB 499]QFG25423.1 hypothetical protein F7P10_33965 [Actinomadura sp. WMMB 499]
MSNATRLPALVRSDNYVVQEFERTGSVLRPITPKQARRIKQKSKHAYAVVDGFTVVRDAEKARNELHRLIVNSLPAEELEDDGTDIFDTGTPDIQPAAGSNVIPLRDENSAVRPCGGVAHCVTKTGNKASKAHKGCQEFEVAA